jgi:hypothetical protein
MKTIMLLFFLVIYTISQGQTIAIKSGLLIDVKSEKAIKNGVVIIYKNKIVEINLSNQVPDSAEIVDLRSVNGKADMLTSPRRLRLASCR